MTLSATNPISLFPPLMVSRLLQPLFSLSTNNQTQTLSSISTKRLDLTNQSNRRWNYSPAPKVLRIRFKQARAMPYYQATIVCSSRMNHLREIIIWTGRLFSSRVCKKHIKITRRLELALMRCIVSKMEQLRQIRETNSWFLIRDLNLGHHKMQDLFRTEAHENVEASEHFQLVGNMRG